MNWEPASLSWLPEAPSDFRDRCRQVSGSGAGRALRELASHRLDGAHLHRLAGGLARVVAGGGSLDPLEPFRLGLLSNGTTEMLIPALAASALRHGLALEVVAAPFGQVAEEMLRPDSPLRGRELDAILLALDHHGLPLGEGLGEPETAERARTAALAPLALVRSVAQAPLIVQTLSLPPETLFGHLDRRIAGTARHFAEDFNRQVAALGDVVFDVAALAESVGTAAWHDPAPWHLARLSFSQRFLPLYAEHIARLLAALRGKSRRCLVLDLDNTLWGGVVGDDGLDGIVLGPGSPAGEAFVEIQRMALALRARGIVLAVCSKNDEAIAREVFRRHPEMLIKEEHIAVFQVNWDDKASNLVAIAGRLNLGIEALVLLDDNPAERERVRQALPTVAVPDLPDDPALFPRVLSAAGYFEAVTFSDDDRHRADRYGEDNHRVELRERLGDLDSYLASLAMRVEFFSFDPANRSRVTQLLNKTNQFNLTTRRHTEATLKAFEENPAAFTLAVRLSDRWGDHGLIGVVIALPSGEDWEIDTWLMSCRVLGRKVEERILAHVVQAARAHGIAGLIGIYRPTGRNALVAELYPRLGFSPLSDGRWRLDLRAEEAMGDTRHAGGADGEGQQAELAV